MKKVFRRITAVILAAATIFGFAPSKAEAAPASISGRSDRTVTFSIETKAGVLEALKSFPAKVTFTQTKGNYVFRNAKGKTVTTYNNRYCQYDITFKVYNGKGKLVNSGSIEFSTASRDFTLKASPFQKYKYVFTIKAHYAYVYSSDIKDWYQGYVWTNPSVWTVKARHDITDMWISRVSKR